jgi:tetratricopeptide (TPR) repeat protein
MEQEEALALIHSEGRRLGLMSVEEAGERVLLHLYQATGGAPLAIKWAMGQIKQKGQSLDTVLAALYEAKGDVFKDIFARSWSLLSEEARCVLIVLPIFTASVSQAAVEAASDVRHYALDGALGQLVEMWLVEATDDLGADKRRYSIHPLTRSFASANLVQQPEFNRDAHLRAIHYFTDLAEKCGGGGWNWHGFDPLEPEKDNIMALLDWCCEQGMWRDALDIKDTLWNFLHVRGYWHDSLRCGLRAIEASRKLANQELLAWHLVFGAGWTYLSQGYFDVAEGMAREALQISEKHGYQRSTALALGNLGIIARERGHLEESKEMYRKSRSIWQNLGERKWAAVALMGLGATAIQGREYDEAQQLLELALKENRELDNEEGIGTALSWLASTAEHMGHFQAAGDRYQEALQVELNLKRPQGIAYSKEGLARASARDGNVEAALLLGQEAQEIYQRLGKKESLARIDAFLSTVGTTASGRS